MPRWTKWLAAGTICTILAAILFPMFARSRGSRRSSCQSNLKIIGMAVLQYSQDYDEKMPLISVNAVASSTKPFKTPYGWADALQPYLKSTQIYQCPQEATTAESLDAARAGFTDYWMNTNLSGIATKKIVDLPTTILCGDGNDGTDGTDARYNRNVLPLYWIKDENSPARRHLDTANYLFSDGHVKSLKPNLVHTTRAKAGDYSFAVK